MYCVVIRKYGGVYLSPYPCIFVIQVDWTYPAVHEIVWISPLLDLYTPKTVSSLY